ncbi:MAG: hypothetical protein J3K34DRAFT_429212 [Monoraphidium minutum]|nr:MAG: hypothetical protein J3K34DRAFT_429212 [Monoraphidium minutum]
MKRAHAHRAQEPLRSAQLAARVGMCSVCAAHWRSACPLHTNSRVSVHVSNIKGGRQCRPCHVRNFTPHSPHAPTADQRANNTITASNQERLRRAAAMAPRPPPRVAASAKAAMVAVVLVLAACAQSTHAQTECPSGTGGKKCKACGGKTKYNPGKRGVLTCKACPRKLQGARFATPDKAGCVCTDATKTWYLEKCWDTSTLPPTCPAGQEVASGVCQPCGDGKFSRGGIGAVCEGCPAGQVPTPDKSACVLGCDAGFARSPVTGQCVGSVTFYDKEGFLGRDLPLSPGNYASLAFAGNDWDNKIRSFSMPPGLSTLRLYDGPGFTGSQLTVKLDAGVTSQASLQLEWHISSIQIAWENGAYNQLR